MYKTYILFNQWTISEYHINTVLDLDECVLNTHDCHKDATCTNTYGLYNCTCNTGWKGEGTGFEGNGTHCYGEKYLPSDVDGVLICWCAY